MTFNNVDNEKWSHHHRPSAMFNSEYEVLCFRPDPTLPPPPSFLLRVLARERWVLLLLLISALTVDVITKKYFNL